MTVCLSSAETFQPVLIFAQLATTSWAVTRAAIMKLREPKIELP